jgi:pimeloyl-ACP methyl ester carboxylesterase
MTPPPEALRTLTARFDPRAFYSPTGRARIRLEVTDVGSWDALVTDGRARLAGSPQRIEPDALLSADEPTWNRMASDMRGGLGAFRARRLSVRRDLNLGVGFLVATSGATERDRLRFRGRSTDVGDVSTLEAGSGPAVVMLHGLGGTKQSFLPTVAALAPAGYRTIAMDLPGFGDTDKPLGASYDAAFFARWVEALLDALNIERAHVLGHSMGGRVALEMGFRYPDRVESLMLMTPSLAWRRDRPWATWLKLLRPELGVLQPTPRRLAEALVYRAIPAGASWAAAGIDDFLRSYLTPRGRAAFYAAARQIYLEEPHGPNGFWTRLEALQSESLFLWGRRDNLVPIAFARHVRDALPAARHVELDCGHIPQFERPSQAHAAMLRFLAGGWPAAQSGAARGAASAG